MKILKFNFSLCAAALLIAASGASCVSAQKNQGKIVVTEVSQAPENKQANSAAAKINVKQIDLPDLQAVLKQNADAKRPLLINLWATWCAPCREEFPELVKIDNEFRQKGLEFVTISLDDLAEKDTEVAKFLQEMRAEKMPAYLLKTADEEAAIAAIAPNWSGALPLTVLYDQNGKAAYTKMGLIKPEVLRQEITKVLNSIASKNAEITPIPVPLKDDPHGFMFSIFGRRALRTANPNSLPTIKNIKITKNQ